MSRHGALLSSLFALLLLTACGSSGTADEGGFTEDPGEEGGGGTGATGGKAGSSGKGGQTQSGGSSAGGSGGQGASSGKGGSSQGGQGQAGSSGTGGSSQAGKGGSASGGAGQSGAGAGGSSGNQQAGAGQGGGAGQTGQSGQGGSSGSPAGGSAGSAGSGGGAVEPCPDPPACDAPPPDPGPERDWNHSFESPIITATGSPNHRGRDLFINPGAEQWIIGKFAYGLTDKDLKDEEVDIYLLRDCGSKWEKLGTSVTTSDNMHSTEEGVEDTGGRVYFQIPQEKALGPGRHRVHMVVAGDLTTTDLFIEVVDPGTPIFISDVDGTLTTSENVEFVKLLTGDIPDTHVDAPEALSLLAKKGYRPMYITARPEFLVQRTREFVSLHKFPPGIVHTTTGLTGALGSAASGYKTGELAMLAAKGLVPSFAFGNTDTDAQAYENGMIKPASDRYFYQFTDTMFGGTTIQEYTELLPKFKVLPQVCQ